ncbi:sugar-binding protein [Paenibacillus sp. FSL W7-1287]|uniref:sugar-binding protein n=1 Tax=Paenibacillus sp. FSL W7-1287 TaxID=2954538 RepID=UPI0030F65BA9
MKKRPRSFLKTLSLMLVITSLVLTNFLNPVTNVSAASSKPAIKHKDTITLTVGDSYMLDILNKPSDATYQWSSNKKAVVTVDAKGQLQAIGAGTAKIYCSITFNKKTIVITSKVTVKEAPMNTEPSKISVDKNGLDAQGRMVAYFGSPTIDGTVDPVWNKAEAVLQKHVTGELDTTATFKALWDDQALYILAEVKDRDLSVESGTPYMQDSIEIFLDENNDKASEYGVDDLHIRINYENALSVDNGNADMYYTAAKKVKDGYVVEARIALKSQPKNGSVLGIELQINDAKGTERAGTINVFDTTGNAWNNPSTFGEILLAGKKKNDTSGLNPYDLMNLIKKTLKLDFKLYKNSDVVTDAITSVISESIFNRDQVNQKQIDEQYAAIKAAVSKLEMTEEAANEKYFTPVPDEYRVESDQPGKIESLYYDAPNLENGKDNKKLNVYLPYGYDSADKSKKYNVLYLMHGGGENEDLIFGGPDQSKELKKILDNMIANGDIEPLIVVTPTFNGGKNDVALFHEELVNQIVPLVETKYHTYAKSGSLEDLKESRAHRAFGGFSMGSVTTWYTFIHALDYFKYYMPLSGDSWIIEQRGGGLQPKQTAEYLAKVARESGYAPHDYYIFSATGNLDIAYPNLKPQVDAMKQFDDVFIYSSDTKKGNFYFIDAEGGTHAWNWQNQYIYDILFDMFKD